MINPFVICNVAEQDQIRQHADYEEWRTRCMALRADSDAIQSYDACARAYAATTVYPNSDVVAYVRRLALQALACGEPMPATPEAAIEAENNRRLLAALGW